MAPSLGCGGRWVNEGASQGGVREGKSRVVVAGAAVIGGKGEYGDGEVRRRDG